MHRSYQKNEIIINNLIQQLISKKKGFKITFKKITGNLAKINMA